MVLFFVQLISELNYFYDFPKKPLRFSSSWFYKGKGKKTHLQITYYNKIKSKREESKRKKKKWKGKKPHRERTTNKIKSKREESKKKKGGGGGEGGKRSKEKQWRE